MEELSDTVGAISLMVITMARRVARRDVEHWKATVRYTGLAGYMGLFHSPVRTLSHPAASSVSQSLVEISTPVRKRSTPSAFTLRYDKYCLHISSGAE